jgi:hypothetical protein
MLDFIERYFHSTDEGGMGSNVPASNEQISKLEDQLNLIFPNDYKEFLKFSNGFEGLINGFVVSFCSVEQIFQNTQINCGKSFPWAIYIGTNVNVEMFVIDKRQKLYQFGLLPFIAEANDFIPLGNTFERFIERLYNNTAFERR